ncbi:MAG: 30S ribosomal protein S16 [Synergistaceae bacterium]|nr:30S ribosomal protein S16 [Synergistaceae bacterium]
MAVRIRLSRQGKKKAPFYRLVVADSRAPRDGKFIELIGTYNPMTDPAAVTIDEERALYWLSQGASPSDTARGLLKKQGIWEKFEAKKA